MCVTYLLKLNSAFFAEQNCSLMQLQSVTRRYEHANWELLVPSGMSILSIDRPKSEQRWRQRERSKRENVKVPGAIEDGRRENRENEDDAHVHLRETGNGYDGNKAKKDGNGKLMAGATVGHRNGTARYINSLLDERRCFCVLRSATIFVHLSCAIGVTSRVPRPTIHAVKTRISR